jgi:hypothetical protein
MTVVDAPFFPAMTPSTVADPLPGPRHWQDQPSRHHRAVLRDDDGGDAVPATPAPPPQWPRVFPGL